MKMNLTIKWLMVFFVTWPFMLKGQTQEQDSVSKVVERQLRLVQKMSYSNPDEAFVFLDSAKNLSMTFDITKGKVAAPLSEIILLTQTGDWERAMAISDSMPAVIAKSGLRQYFSKHLRIRSNLLGQQGKLSESIYTMTEALDSAQAMDDSIMVAVITSNLGNRYYAIGADEKALEYFLKSLDIKIRLGQEKKLPFAYQGIAAVYYRQENYEKAREEAARAVEGFKQAGNPCAAVQMICMISGTYVDGKNHTKAREVLTEAFKLSEQNDCTHGYYYAQYIRGNLENDAGNLEEALTWFDKALEGSRVLTASIRNTIRLEQMNIYSKLGQLSKAAQLKEICYKESHELNTLHALRLYYQTEVMYYEKSGLWKNALASYRTYQSYSDSLRNEERDQLEEETRVKFDVAQLEGKQASLTKDLILARKDNEIKVQDLELVRKNNTIKNWLIAFISLLLIGGGVVGWLLFQNQKNRSRRKEMKLSQQLRRSQINPHFFFNVLNSIQAQINRSQDKKQVVRNVATFARLMRQTLESSFHDFVAIEEETDRLKNYISLQNLRFATPFEYSIVNHCDREVNIPSQIIQPFVENAIEHGFKDESRQGELLVTFSFADQQRVKIEIKDNGEGLGEDTTNPERKSRALEIIAKRLQLFGGRNKFFYELHRENQFTIATVFCPFR